MSTNEDSQINNKSKRKYKLDDIDIAILNNLQQNARISNIDLANTVGISASPCLRRVKNLIDSNIIENFKTTLNKNYFGYNLTIFASITIDKVTDEVKFLIEKELSLIDQIQEVYNLHTETDYLIKIIAKDITDYKSIIHDKISTKIPNIKSIRTTQIKQIIKQDNSLKLNI